MKHLNILALAWLFGAGCCSTSHTGSATAVDETKMASEKYVLRQPEIKADLFLWRNGNYSMSAEGESGAGASETGFWIVEGPDLVLFPQNGPAGGNLRLRPAPGGARQSFIVADYYYDQGPRTLGGLIFERESP